MKPDSPETCIQRFAACVSKGDLDGASGSFEEAATFVRDDKTLVNGRAAIREALAGFVDARPNLEIQVQRVVGAGEDLAIVYNEWSFDAREQDGSLVPNAGGTVQVLRRAQDGTWRIVFDDPGRWLR